MSEYPAGKFERGKILAQTWLEVGKSYDRYYARASRDGPDSRCFRAGRLGYAGCQGHSHQVPQKPEPHKRSQGYAGGTEAIWKLPGKGRIKSRRSNACC